MDLMDHMWKRVPVLRVGFPPTGVMVSSEPEVDYSEKYLALFRVWDHFDSGAVFGIDFVIGSWEDYSGVVHRFAERVSVDIPEAAAEVRFRDGVIVVRGAHGV